MSRLHCALLVASVLAVTLACAGRSPTAPTELPPHVGPATIRGTVRDFVTTAPRGLARLEFTSDVGAGVVTAVTTDSGAYGVTVPATGAYTVRLSDTYVGTLQVTGPSYVGDLLVDSGSCTSRYGVLTDARTSRPVSGASVSLPARTVTSGADGSYRIDLGCEPSLGFNTTFIMASHPGYQLRQQVVGRGVHNVVRLDLVLEPNP